MLSLLIDPDGGLVSWRPFLLLSEFA